MVGRDRIILPMVTTAYKLLKEGYDVLRLNLRDHGDTQHLNKEIFNSTMMPEVADCIELFLNKRSYSKKFWWVFRWVVILPCVCC